MAVIDYDFLEKLVARFSGYKSPNEAQQLILILAEKEHFRSEDEERTLSFLIRAEKQADKLFEARAKAKKLIDAEKKKQRRIDTQKKIIWGAALIKAAQNNAEARQAVLLLWEAGLIADKDKKLLQDDYDAISKPEYELDEFGDPIQPEPDFYE